MVLLFVYHHYRLNESTCVHLSHTLVLRLIVSHTQVTYLPDLFKQMLP